MSTGDRITSYAYDDAQSKDGLTSFTNAMNLTTQPKSVAGKGYIAVELAWVFQILSSETHLVVRKKNRSVALIICSAVH